MPKKNKFKKINDNFIETGSYLGDGIRLAIESGFENIISIELSENYFNKCKETFKNHQNVNLILGDSYYKLSSILKNNNLRYTYWLDGHYSGGDTANGVLEFPIMKELEVILNRNISGEIIYIDDMRILRDYSKEININSIKNIVEKYKTGCNIHFEPSDLDDEDIMVIEY